MKPNTRVYGPAMAVLLSLGVSVSATTLAENHQHHNHGGGEPMAGPQGHNGHGQHGQGDNRDRGQGQKRGHDQHQGHDQSQGNQGNQGHQGHQGHQQGGRHESQDGSGGHHQGHGAHQAGHGASVGKPGNRENITRTISITGDDTMAFRHPPISVRVGETILFEVTNTGSMAHEFSIGTLSDHRAHQVMMLDNPGMSHEDMPGSINLAPGETGQLVWLFDSMPDEPLEVACNLPGHYQAGMFSQVRIRE